MDIRKGDKVFITKGKDKGKSNKVIRVVPKDGTVVIEGLNMRKKTIRPKKQGEKGQVVEVPWSMKIDNVMLVCSSCGKPSRIGHKIEGDKKVRYCKRCKAAV
ncbi:MAG: Ribosomal protein L24 [Parcubacteria group bacterium GW2011_GWB1_45_7]|uniref:Large ribosomal subunit protein uL24 n=4 Tax=Parcubacteria group TaxID=1794811 RepID=A0A0H4TC58_9BACT|nr:LSU ribosomal protein L24P [uncultured Parcubacteria bacterium Rifle_16ft_4_minimus_37647]AKQ05591.1 LSU ribosomal protein L24P [uncultured Parcubacteria bacterium Rifle_16ft_4_minimus_23790]KKU11937.1 MAG: Ribosomal protein L24 [Parcubacteria group bacterium GW2011_GWB1_45_7]OGY58607.1 MAG: 50S ribosomal protein L24 [Candidatus Colwellbacteria bacterium RIFCSPHIGHO2_02_FULL_45_17]OGY61702.1 MAG: 50S ribosomal protein L24 [Candidatus Colwellbacteria bacterium RIFCSPLOWO2_02_FULL_45_11]OGY62